jgi:cytochrome b pre-mRNA-processing protein 3
MALIKRLKILIFGNPDPDGIAERLYRAVVAQSRLPAFYRDFGAPDTPVGRLEVLHLHLFLFSRRLSVETAARAATLSQVVFDLHAEDLDRALRELGVGDTSVPARKKRMLKGFYGQIAELGPALDAGDRPACATAFAARFGDETLAGERFARYAIASAKMLAGQSVSEIASGVLLWPDPERLP